MGIVTRVVWTSEADYDRLRRSMIGQIVSKVLRIMVQGDTGRVECTSAGDCTEANMAWPVGV